MEDEMEKELKEYSLADSEIETFIGEYIKDIVNGKNYNRYLSWDYCYQKFGITNNKPDDNTCDYLALHLAAYLSSWGMYRGSSFLLQKNYKVHIPVVKIVMDEKYKKLRGISAENLQADENLKLLTDISNEIRDYYKGIEPSFEGKDNNATDTLVTKILLGTLGCVPAFDKNVVEALRKSKDLSGSYNVDAIKKISKFYIDRKNIFESTKKNPRLDTYPPMKLVDMCFWKLGEKLIKQKENHD